VKLSITADQITKLAPDASAASAGKKLSAPKYWKNVGYNEQALWGECQGSALYQVRIELSTLTAQCSCPSRKLPCKHSLALLLLNVNTPTAVPEGEPLEWVVSWLAKRAATQKRKETIAADTTVKQPAASASAQKNKEKRQEKVKQGIDQLDLWLNDLIRNGLGSLESQSTSIWEQQAAQMVDAQATGLAASIRSMSATPHSSQTWSEKLLGQLGKLALLTEAYRHIERAPEPLQEDIRQLIGWVRKEPEIRESGLRVTDDWLFLGQHTEGTDRGRTQYTWLQGITTGKAALLLQFSFAGAPFTENYPSGMQQKAEIAYWPGAVPQRALFTQRQEAITAIQRSLPGVATFDAFFEQVAHQLACHPWRERFLCILSDGLPIYETSSKRWSLCDQTGQALPLTQDSNEYWKLLALSGGHPVDFVGEWNGETLLPLGVLVDHSYHLL
jgi:uncharacterized Zn finger protein